MGYSRPSLREGPKPRPADALVLASRRPPALAGQGDGYTSQRQRGVVRRHENRAHRMRAQTQDDRRPTETPYGRSHGSTRTVLQRRNTTSSTATNDALVPAPRLPALAIQRRPEGAPHGSFPGHMYDTMRDGPRLFPLVRQPTDARRASPTARHTGMISDARETAPRQIFWARMLRVRVQSMTDASRAAPRLATLASIPTPERLPTADPWACTLRVGAQAWTATVWSRTLSNATIDAPRTSPRLLPWQPPTPRGTTPR